MFGDCDMSVELTTFVTVFRTGQLVHLDWASNALEEQVFHTNAARRRREASV